MPTSMSRALSSCPGFTQPVARFDSEPFIILFAALESNNGTRAVSDPVKSETRSTSLSCRNFATRNGIRFAGNCSSSISQADASESGKSRPHRCVNARPSNVIPMGLGVSRVDVMKIDVEGSELRVLRGASHTLKQHRPVLIIELDDQLFGRMGASSAEIRDLLASCGYSPSGRFDGTRDAANVKFVSSAIS